jgi:hypothetical protein
MSEYSNFHYRDRTLRVSPQPTPEIIRNEVWYRGFKLRRGDPNAGYMWNIFDGDGKPIIGGSFTKLPLAEFAVDKYLDEKGLATQLDETN